MARRGVRAVHQPPALQKRTAQPMARPCTRQSGHLSGHLRCQQGALPATTSPPSAPSTLQRMLSSEISPSVCTPHCCHSLINASGVVLSVKGSKLKVMPNVAVNKKFEIRECLFAMHSIATLFFSVGPSAFSLSNATHCAGQRSSVSPPPKRAARASAKASGNAAQKRQPGASASSVYRGVSRHR